MREFSLVVGRLCIGIEGGSSCELTENDKKYQLHYQHDKLKEELFIYIRTLP